MNERISELAKQAGDDWDHTLPSDREFLNKFAELIVRECVLISRTGTDGFSAGRRMEQHFGVEQ
jgi:hypothetical protein